MMFEEAHSVLNDVESMLTDDLVVARIRYLLERGRTHNSANEKDKARPLFLEALEIAVAKKEDNLAVDAAHMMQIVEPPEKQLEWADKAIQMAEASTDERARDWLGPLYNNTGWTYFDLKQYDKALELFQKGLEWRTSRDDENGVRIQTWNIARTYRAIGKIDEALELQKRLEREFEEEELDPDGYVFEELGECYLLKGNAGEAQPYFRRAHEILSKDKWFATNEPDRLSRMKELGGF
jgi:tetratricopeptide (TPR) repeat protein